MPHWPHLESPDSIIEILWDVALVVFAIRLALLYAALTFASSAVLLILFSLAFHDNDNDINSTNNKVITTTTTTIRNTALTNALTTHHPHALPLLTLAAAAVSSRVLIRRYDIPRVLGFRLAVGVGAGVVVGLVAGMLWLVECEVLGRALMEGLLVMDGGGGGGGGGSGGWKTGVGVVGGFVLMPAAMMGWEIGGEKVVGLLFRGTGDKGERAGDNIGQKKVMGSCDL